MSIGRDRRRDNEERIRLVAMARGDGLFPQSDLPGCDCRAMSNAWRALRLCHDADSKVITRALRQRGRLTTRMISVERSVAIFGSFIGHRAHRYRPRRGCRSKRARPPSTPLTWRPKRHIKRAKRPDRDFHNNIDLRLTFGASQSASGHRG
jgi:hypothetical protein